MNYAPVVLAAALALTGCQQKPEQSQDAPASEPMTGMAARDGHLVLPAVTGNPGAAYFTVANGTGTDSAIAAVFVEGSDKAEMHETRGGSMAPLTNLIVSAGQSVAFKPGGKHVMVFGIDPKIAAGATAEITLTFANGDKLSAPLKVEAVGGTEH